MSRYNPAYAGTTFSFLFLSIHPRVCGDYVGARGHGLWCYDTTPRMRGAATLQGYDNMSGEKNQEDRLILPRVGRIRRPVRRRCYACAGSTPGWLSTPGRSRRPSDPAAVRLMVSDRCHACTHPMRQHRAVWWGTGPSARRYNPAYAGTTVENI